MPPKKKKKEPDRRFAEDFLKKWKKIEPRSDHSRFERILKAQEDVLSKDPANIEALMQRGKILVEMELFADAVEAFDAVVKIKPDYKEAWNARGNALSLQGRYDEAATSYRKALELVSTKIEKKYKKVLSEERAIEDMLEELVTDEFEERHLKELGKYESRLSKNKGDADAWYGKGQILRDMGRSKEALNALHEVTKIDPNYPNVWKVKGDLYTKLGDETKASICYKRAMEYLEEAQICPLCDNVLPIGLTSCPTCGAKFGDKVEKDAKAKKKRPKARKDKGERLEPTPAFVPEMDEKPKPKKPPKGPPPKDLKELVSELQPERKFDSKEGKVNGLARATGRINGLRVGKVNGRVNGVGKVNGLVNGVGRVNGLVNGMGRVNGLVNGMGRVNGLISQIRTGRVNGLVNGFSSTRRGLSNGITNGAGLTNGLGGRRFGRDTMKGRWKMFVIPLIAMALIVTPYLSLVQQESYVKINIDGEFSDWTGFTRRVQELPQLNANIDIVNIGLEDNGAYLSFFIETKGTILTGGNGVVDTFMVFIDYDLNADTGYRIDSLGADFMARIYGIDAKLKGSTIHQFDDLGDRDDWSGWSTVGNLPAASSGNRLEAQVPWDTLGEGEKQVDALFYSQDYDLGEDFADNIVSNVKGILAVQARSSETETFIGGDNPVLEIAFEAVESDIDFTELNISLMGTADASEIGNLRLIDTGTDTTLKQIAPTGKHVTFSLDSPLHIGESAKKELAVLADVTGFSGHTLGGTIESSRDIRIETGTVSLEVLPSDSGLGYIGFVPQNFTIDGGFSDWTTPVPDSDALSISNPDIDMSEYDLASEDESFYFYVSVKGEMLDGTPVPYRNRIRGEHPPPGPLDSDGDTVPDEFDSLPYNFDNQGLDDIDTYNDVDEDGIKDYPYGDDYWLNTTIPASFPAPYGGKPVSIFIGPTTEPPLTGEDTLRIYIDKDPAISEGYSVDTIYADYMIRTTGKNGEVFASELYEFPPGTSPGNGNAWTLLGQVQYMKGVSGIEGLAELGAPLNVSTAEALIEIVDVHDELDDADLAIADATKGIGSVGAKSSKKILPMFSPPASNRFLVYNVVYHRIDSDSDQISNRITLQSAISIDELYVYLAAVGGGANKNFRVGIQGDSSGNPDGTYDCSFTFNVGSATGWKSGTSLGCGIYSAGQVIHAVIQYDSGGGSWGSNWIDMLSTTPHNQLRPYDGSSDTNSNVLFNSGSGWTAQNDQPVVIVKETSGGQDGNPYTGGGTATIAGTPTNTGQGNKFQVSSATTMNQAEFRVGWVIGIAPLYLKIRNVDDNIEMVSVSKAYTAIPAGSSCSAAGWVTFNFAPQTFVTGKTYAIYLHTNGGLNGYVICVTTTSDSSPQNLVTFDGTTTFRTSVVVSGPSFTDYTYQDIPFVLVPEFSDTIIPIFFVMIIPVAISCSRRKKKRKL